MKHRAVVGFRDLWHVVFGMAAGWLAVGSVLPSPPPLLFVGMCLLGMAVIAGAVGLCREPSSGREDEDKARFAALLATAGMLAAGLAAIQSFDAGTDALIFYLVPLWLVMMEWTSNGRTQPLVDVVALACGLLGLGMLASGSASVSASRDMPGFALFSMVMFNSALGTWLRQARPGDVDPWCHIVFRLAAAGAIVMVASLALERRLDRTQLPILAWPLAFNLVMTTGVAFVACCCEVGTSLRPRQHGLVRPKSAIGSEKIVETSDAGCDTSLSPDEDRRGGRPCRLVHRRPEPVYGPGHRGGAAGPGGARPARLRDRPGVPPEAHKA